MGCHVWCSGFSTPQSRGEMIVRAPPQLPQYCRSLLQAHAGTPKAPASKLAKCSCGYHVPKLFGVVPLVNKSRDKYAHTRDLRSPAGSTVCVHCVDGLAVGKWPCDFPCFAYVTSVPPLPFHGESWLSFSRPARNQNSVVLLVPIAIL